MTETTFPERLSPISRLREGVKGNLLPIRSPDVSVALDRIRVQSSLLIDAHDLLHRLTAIIPFNDAGYAATMELMARIRTEIGTMK